MIAALREADLHARIEKLVRDNAPQHADQRPQDIAAATANASNAPAPFTRVRDALRTEAGADELIGFGPSGTVELEIAY